MSVGRRWWLAGGLLAVAGGLTAVSTHRHWAPCRLAPAAPACADLQTATHGFPAWGTPGAAVLPHDPVSAVTAMVAALLLAVAWVVVIGWRDGWPYRIMLVLVGVQPLIALLLSAYEWWAPDRPLSASVGDWLCWPAEAYVFPVLLGAGWLLNESARVTARLMALAWAVTSFGPLHHFGDYVIAKLLVPGGVIVPSTPAFSPPGLGYATAGVQLALAVVVVVLRPGGRRGDGRPRRGDHTLAA